MYLLDDLTTSSFTSTLTDTIKTAAAAAAAAAAPTTTDTTENNSLSINFNFSNIVQNEFQQLNVPYTLVELLVAIVAVIGNAMVIAVFQRERRLRRRTNYYIVSLALADLLVGLFGVPFAILASIGLPTYVYTCLFTISLLIVLCTISIFCLVAVSVDRYWAILYPLAYSKNVSTKTAIYIISFCWFLGGVVGFLPLFGWHSAESDEQACYFVEIMDYNYLVFLYVATIILPALVLLCFYVHIYTVIIRQVRQTVTFNSAEKSFKTNTCSYSISKPNSGAMLRVLGAARKREIKATQNLSIIVIFFMMCWLPLYTINCIKAFCPECHIDASITFAAIILSHLNSAVNPLLYAYNLKDFRAAMKTLILKMIGKDTVPIQSNLNYRFSIASQHRIQTLVERQQIGSRIYVDSPVWKRQQQQQLRKCHSVIGSSPVSQKIPTKSQRALSMQMWNITEVPSAASDNNHLTAATANSSSNSNSNSSSESATNIVNRQYSFNYDHLDDDISSFKQVIDNVSSDHTMQPGNAVGTNQKMSLNISMDNLSSISVDTDFKLKQISFMINVRLESSNFGSGSSNSGSRKKTDLSPTTTTVETDATREKHKNVRPSVTESHQSFNRKLSQSDTNVNRNVLKYDDIFAPTINNVCRKRKTGAENFSFTGNNSVTASDRCLKRVKSDSNCIEFHM